MSFITKINVINLFTFSSNEKINNEPYHSTKQIINQSQNKRLQLIHHTDNHQQHYPTFNFNSHNKNPFKFKTQITSIPINSISLQQQSFLFTYHSQSSNNYMINQQEKHNPMNNNTTNSTTSTHQDRQDLSIEQILGKHYSKYMQNQTLVKELYSLQEKEVQEPFIYLWEKKGKKLRMVLALVISSLFKAEAPLEAIKIGGLIEILHCASLIIDDIQDGSLQRRGQKCTHLIYGIDNSINAANMMYFLPAQKLFDSFTDDSLKWKLAKIYLKQMSKCHVGQGLDVRTHRAKSQSELPNRQEYFRLCRMKTGGLLRMLVEMLAAVLLVDNESLNLLVECMESVGVAYQIGDDLLNIARDVDLGKGIQAQDFHQRKFTLVIDELRYNQEFISLFFVTDKTAEQIQKMLRIVENSSVVEHCRATAKQYANAAIEAIDKLRCPYGKQDFKKVICYIVDRKI